MTDSCFWLNPLRAGDALAVLAADTVRLGSLQEADIRLRPLEGGWCRFVVPDPERAPGGVTGRARRRQAYAELKTGLAGLGVEVAETEAPEPIDDRLDIALDAALIWLLLNAGEEAGPPAAPREGERALLFAEPSDTDLAARYDLLRDHATSLRIMAGHDDAGSMIVFCHVRTDPERLETFEALLTSGRLGGAAVLDVFDSPEGLICLPPGLAPPVLSLQHLARLAGLAWYEAAVLGPQEAARRAGQPFLAVAVPPIPETPGEEALAVYLLRGLQPVAAEHLHPPRRVRIAILRLARPEEAMADLQRRLVEADPPVGYRPVLREGYAPEQIDAEIERLADTIRLMEDRLVYLDGLRAPNWRLLRFTQAQLPGLVQVLRGTPPADLERGALRYGFQATARDPAGLHYLLFQPGSAAASDPFPARLRYEEAREPMAFALDPYWARYYHHGRGESLLFVPEGSALVPPLHSWDRSDMDSHLRGLATALCETDESADGPASMPERPVYVFTPDKVRHDGLLLEVLDFDAFAPVHARLGWINANIELVDALPADELIAAMAAETARSALVQRVLAESRAAEARVRTSTDAARRAAVAELGALLDEIGGEIDRTIADIRGVTAELAGRQRDLAVLNDALADATGMAGTAFRRFEAHVQTVKAYGEQRDRIEQEVMAELRNARALADEVGERLKAHIDDLLQARDELGRRLGRG